MEKKYYLQCLTFLLCDLGWCETHIYRRCRLAPESMGRNNSGPFGSDMAWGTLILDYEVIHQSCVMDCCYIFVPICFLHLISPNHVLLHMHTCIPSIRQSSGGEWQPHSKQCTTQYAQKIPTYAGFACWRGGKPHASALCR